MYGNIQEIKKYDRHLLTGYHECGINSMTNFVENGSNQEVLFLRKGRVIKNGFLVNFHKRNVEGCTNHNYTKHSGVLCKTYFTTNRQSTNKDIIHFLEEGGTNNDADIWIEDIADVKIQVFIKFLKDIEKGHHGGIEKRDVTKHCKHKNGEHYQSVFRAAIKFFVTTVIKENINNCSTKTIAVILEEKIKNLVKTIK